MHKKTLKSYLGDFIEILVDYQLRSSKLPSKEEEDVYRENNRIYNRFIPHLMIVIDADQEQDTKVLSLLHGLVSARHHRDQDLNGLSPRKYQNSIMKETIKLYERLYDERN